jgi:hypothetical protein
MLKKEEISDPNSCLNRALDEEGVFTLLERDKAAPDTIRYWCRKRIELGESTSESPEIKSALRDAAQMESSRDLIRQKLGKMS